MSSAPSDYEGLKIFIKEQLEVYESFLAKPLPVSIKDQYLNILGEDTVSLVIGFTLSRFNFWSSQVLFTPFTARVLADPAGQDLVFRVRNHMNDSSQLSPGHKYPASYKPLRPLISAIHEARRVY